jgi:imidazole glycerol-phosphate synthase subunit HisF
MLKKRIVANVVVRDGVVVQSIGFKKYLPVGKPAIALEFLNSWGIDEIILTDISATKNKRKPYFDIIRDAAKKCYVPLTVGGGISTIDDIRELMNCGADKISLNQTALLNPQFITTAAHIFGDQCIVVSIDAIKTAIGYSVYDYLQKKATERDVVLFSKEMQAMGAGELLINSVDKDGSYLGYEIDLLHAVCSNVTVPVICCGGAKNAYDFAEVFTKTTVSAACAANFFHFTEHSVNTTKANILKYIDVRLETYADYKENEFDETYRLIKKPDSILEEMLFIKIEKEII